MSPVPHHILIFEPQAGGHRAEFIGHLIEHIVSEKAVGKRYSLVISHGFSFQNEGLAQRAVSAGIVLREITAVEKQALNKSRGPLGGFVFWRILRSYMSELKPSRLILMDLTWLELPLCFYRPACPFLAILFVQYPELRNTAHRSWRQRLKFRIKEAKTRLLLKNPMLRKVFLLNGAFACQYLNTRFQTECFVPLPDPVLAVEAEEGFQLRQEFGIEPGCRIFLFFGSMSARKGVDGLVKNLTSLSPAAAQQTAFIFCGVPEARYAEHYHELVQSLTNHRPDISLHVVDHFVPEARMRVMFEQADWILLPYTRPEYSSGILAHAAAASTPVIGPADGLVGRLIREVELGLGCSLDLFDQAIEKAVDEAYVFNESARQAFVLASSPERFAAHLLEGEGAARLRTEDGGRRSEVMKPEDRGLRTGGGSQSTEV